jgi:DnaA family protein
MQQLPLALGLGLGAEADFDAYLAGPNREAVAAVEDWATGGQDAFVYVFGPSGTGKTHLLLAACRRASERSATAIYLPLADPRLRPSVLDGLERSELVALDDLHAVAGHRDWEMALFGVYNRLREHRRRLLMSADVPAPALALVLPDLRSRIGWGPGYRLQALRERDCEQLLRQAAERRGLRLGEDATHYIMRRCRREPRQLMMLLERLDQASLSRKRRPTLALIRELLKAPATSSLRRLGE